MKKLIIITLAAFFIQTGILPAVAAEQTTISVTDAVRMAVEKNPAVTRAKELVQGAQYARDNAKSGFYPNLAADYGVAALYDDPYMITAGHQIQVAHKTLYNWGVTLVQPLYTGGAVSSRYNMAKLQISVMEKEKEQTILDLAKVVKSAYYRVLLAEKIRQVADEAVVTLSSHEQDAQKFYDHGVIRLNDLLRAKVALSDALQMQERSRADIDIALADLNRQLAMDINADTRIEHIDEVQFIHPDLGVMIDDGLRLRPQLSAMALVRRTMDEAIELEKSGYYPTVSLVGNYYQSGDTPLADSNDYENDHNASIMLQAKWTFFDGNKTRSGVARAVSDQKAYDDTIRQAKDQIRVEIKSAFLNLGVAEHNVETSKVTLSQAEENMRITQLGYRQQAATSTEVLDARTDLTTAKTNYFQALYGYLDARADLDHATGRKIPVTGLDHTNDNTSKESMHE